MTRRTGMSALLSVGTTVALMGMALAQSASPSGSPAPGGYSGGSRDYPGSSGGPGPGSSSSGSSSSGGAYGAPGDAQTAGAIDSTSTTTTVEYGTDGGYGAGVDTAVDTAPLDNTGGEPLVITLLGSLVAGSALLMRRKLSAN